MPYTPGPGKIPRTIFGRGADVPSMVVTLTPIKVPEYFARLKVWDKKMQKAAARGVKKACDLLLKETLKVTPVVTGKLRDAGKTYVVEQGPRTRGFVYFDEKIAPYAIYVHEDLTKYHKSPTMAKFLIRTHYKIRGDMSRLVYEEMSKVRP